MSINGTDFGIQQKGSVAKGNDLASFKLNGNSALRYKISLDILEGNLTIEHGEPLYRVEYDDIN
jgi:hypothetical protein